MQLDAGWIDASDAVEAAAEAATPGGLDSYGRVRRAFLGVDGTIPGGVGFRAEADIAGGEFTWTDVYLTYQASDSVRLTLGNQKPLWGLEELTSDLFTSFMERAAINTTFGYERKTGLGVAYSNGPVILQAGAYLDDLDSIFDGTARGHSFSGRAVYAPKIGTSQAHMAANFNHVDLGEGGAGLRYSARPFVRANTRFVDTGMIADITSETRYGLEGAYIAGRFHATGEMFWHRADRPGALPEPAFYGGYAEIGYFLTKGDKRGYKAGAFDRTKPARPLGKGGFGAVQVNLRYDYLDLDDSGISGGKQEAYAASLIWTPLDRVRLMANYARLQFDNAVIPVNGDRSYGADAFGMRAQFDF